MAIGVALLLLTATSVASPRTCEAEQAGDGIPAGVCGMPADVQKLVIRQETCIHFAGEEPYDAARRREIERAIRDTCHNETRAASLMSRYRKEPTVAAWLRQYVHEKDLQPRP